jgi:hypothetical protein
MSEGSEPTPAGITVTVRFVKSFEYRTVKALVLHNVDPMMTLEQLGNIAKESESSDRFRSNRRGRRVG